MRILKCVLMTLGLLSLGCHALWEPKFGLVVGVVRYPDKTPVFMARVSIEGSGSTMTDMQGHYRLELRSSADTVTVLARDGFTPGMSYAVTHSGSARAVRHGTLIIQAIVLDHPDPI